MKRYKGRLLGGLIAVLALTALVVPAMASAAVWKKSGTTVTSNFELGLTGAENYEVESSAGGVQCNEHMTMAYNATTKVTQITKFENKGSCKTFGTYASCTAQTVEAIGLPWTVTQNTSTLTVTNMHMKHTFKTGCAKPEINQTLNMTVNLFSPTAISEMEFIGTSGAYKQFGSLTVDSPNSGVYGIG
jgi:hypothetical protein